MTKPPWYRSLSYSSVNSRLCVHTLDEFLSFLARGLPSFIMASSHMARRTFIGNIYKLVKDPNLVSALTGHAEGSRAFNRYRDIDIDMKRDLVKILEGKR